jgi:hypothetical protein
MDRNNGATIYFVRGLPGTGKTTLSKRIKKYLDAALLDPDTATLTKVNLPPDTRLKKHKYRLILKKAVAQILKGKTVVWCQPWRKSKNINLTVENIKKLSGIKSINTFVIETLPDKPFSFQNSKNQFPSKSYYSDYADKYVPLSGFDGAKYILLKESYTNTDIFDIVKKFLNII